MTWFLKIFSVFWVSAIKFVFAAPMAKMAGLTYSETIISSITGGIFGVTIFLFLSKYVYQILFYFKSLFKKIFLNKNTTVIIKKKKIFTKRNRWFVSFINKYGLLGISLLTPCILSIPIGTILAGHINSRIIKNTFKVWTYLCISVILWAFIFSTIVYQICS